MIAVAKVDEINNVLRNFYDTLENVQYPEVAQTRFEEFESKILTGVKRIYLLQWILEECPTFSSVSLNKIKGNALNDKVFKCYSQMGLCSDESILLGNYPVDKQLQFLTLLTIFVKSVHPIENKTSKNEKGTSNTLIKVKIESENIDPNSIASPSESKTTILPNISYNLVTDKVGINDQIEMKTEELHSLSDNINQQKLDNFKFNEICSDMKENITVLSTQEIDHYKSILQKSNSSFKTVLSLSTQDRNSNSFSEHYSDLSIDLDRIHSTFSIVNKALNSKAKIKNEEIPENSLKIIKPSTEAIKNNLVSIEQACNIYTES